MRIDETDRRLRMVGTEEPEDARPACDTVAERFYAARVERASAAPRIGTEEDEAPEGPLAEGGSDLAARTYRDAMGRLRGVGFGGR